MAQPANAAIKLAELPSDALQLIAEALVCDESLAVFSIRRLSKDWERSVLRAAADLGTFKVAQRLLLVRKLQQRRFGRRARKVVVFGEYRSGKSTLCKQLLRASGAGRQSLHATRGRLLAQAVETMQSLVELCDAQHIEIRDESATQRFELLLGDGLLEELERPEEAQEEAQEARERWPPVFSLLERLSRDVGISEAAARSDNACAVHNLPRLLARCRALYCDHQPYDALQPDDDLLLYVRSTGVAELPELAWPRSPAPPPPSAGDQPLPPLLRLNVVDCVGHPLERRNLEHYLDGSVHLACFVASLPSMATTAADGGAVGLAATVDLLEAFYRVLASRAPRARLLIILTQRAVLVSHIERVGPERWEERWPAFARGMKLDAMVGQSGHGADYATRYFARELIEAVNRARSSDTPEAAARHRNIAPRVEVMRSALDLEEVRGSLWPDRLAIELLGGWSAVFTPAATRSLVDEAEAERRSSGEEDDLPASGAAKPKAAPAKSWISERLARLLRAVRI